MRIAGWLWRARTCSSSACSLASRRKRSKHACIESDSSDDEVDERFPAFSCLACRSPLPKLKPYAQHCTAPSLDGRPSVKRNVSQKAMQRPLGAPRKPPPFVAPPPPTAKERPGPGRPPGEAQSPADHQGTPFPGPGLGSWDTRRGPIPQNIIGEGGLPSLLDSYVTFESNLC